MKINLGKSMIVFGALLAVVMVVYFPPLSHAIENKTDTEKNHITMLLGAAWFIYFMTAIVCIDVDVTVWRRKQPV